MREVTAVKRLLVVAVVGSNLLAGCSGDDGDVAHLDEPAATTTTAAPSLVGEAAVTGPLTGGQHGFPQTSTPFDLDAAGYVEEEFLLDGEATSYRYADEPGDDGEWSAEPADTAPYTTRILVRRPEDPAAFNGTVVVEWLNVTSNVDLDVDFGFLAEELLRKGYAWVGVTAQEIAVTSTGGGQFGDAPSGCRPGTPRATTTSRTPATPTRTTSSPKPAPCCGPRPAKPPSAAWSPTMCSPTASPSRRSGS